MWYPFCCCQFLDHILQSVVVCFFQPGWRGRLSSGWALDATCHRSVLCVTNPVPQVPPHWMRSYSCSPCPPLSSASFPWQVNDPCAYFVLHLESALGSSDRCWIFKTGKREKWAGSCQLLCPQLIALPSRSLDHILSHSTLSQAWLYFFVVVVFLFCFV